MLGELLVGRLETLRFALARSAAARGLADGTIDDVGALVVLHLGREKRRPALVIADVCSLRVSSDPGRRLFDVEWFQSKETRFKLIGSWLEVLASRLHES